MLFYCCCCCTVASLHIQLYELGEHIFLAYALEEALAALEQLVQSRTLTHRLKHVVCRALQQTIRHELDHAIINGDVEWVGHVAQQRYAVVGDGVVELLSVLTGLDAVKGGNDRRKRAGAQVKLLVGRHEGDLIGTGNHGNLLHGSALFRLGVHDEVGTSGVLLADGDSESGEVSTLDDKVNVILGVRADVAMVSHQLLCGHNREVAALEVAVVSVLAAPRIEGEVPGVVVTTILSTRHRG